MSIPNISYETAEELRLARVVGREDKRKFKMRIKPTTTKQWAMLADDFLNWCRSTKHIDVNKYAIEKGYPPYSFYKWGAQNEYFQEALELGTYIVGVRRLEAQSSRDKEILRTMALYDLRLADYEASLKRCNHEEKETQINVGCDHCTKWPSSSQVKEPKKDGK